MAESRGNAEDSKVLSVEPLDSKEAKWIKQVKITYQDPLGKTGVWESAERTTRPSGAEVDGVGIVALLKKPGGPEILLQKQFRPPVGKVCIEVPAGLLDEGESPEACAVRELREETGYVGEAAAVDGKEVGKGIMFNDPGFTNTNLQLVYVDVDLDREENHPENLRPEPEEHEFITTFSVPLARFYSELRNLEAQGYAVDARVGTLAEGIRLAQRFGIGS